MTMDQMVQDVLSCLEKQSNEEGSLSPTSDPEHDRARLDTLMLPIGPESGRFLNFLIRILNRTRILELGGGVGYSTLWLAEAVRHTGGSVTSVERNISKVAAAINHVVSAGLLGVCDLRHAEAMEFLATESGPWDFVLLDLWKDFYSPCFELLLDKLVPSALVVADNMHRPPEVRHFAADYQAFVRSHQNVLSLDFPIGNGLELTWILS